jgi:putative phosphoribosyl transferase
MTERHVRIPADGALLQGDLRVPSPGASTILFAHGSGSSRLSPRNRFVAESLNRAGFGTLLVDLLTREEEQEEAFTGHMRFDIGLLSDRLAGCVEWLLMDPDTQGAPIGLFGASTGAAAAIVAATRKPDAVKAVVSRGGRPDLAGAALARCDTPVLLLVGDRDAPIIPLNERAFAEIRSSNKEMRLIAGATHLFEEPGTLENVARMAVEWFSTYSSSG